MLQLLNGFAEFTGLLSPCWGLCFCNYCFLLPSCGEDSNRVSVFEVPKMEVLTYISYM